MAKRITVSRSQVAAAKLKVKRSTATGRFVDSGTKAIAGAKKVTRGGESTTRRSG